MSINPGSNTYSGTVDNYGVWTYKDVLIYYMCETFTNWFHRDLTVLKDPFAHIYICKLDSEILAERPIFVPDIFGGKDKKEQPQEDPNQEINEEIIPLDDDSENEESPTSYNILDEWILEDWQGLLKTIFDKARAHRFIIVELYNSPPYWAVFYEKHIIEIEYKGRIPVKAHIKYTDNLPLNNGKFGEYDRWINLTTQYDADGFVENRGIFIPFGKSINDDELGISDLEPIWSLLILMRYCMFDIANNSAKTSGFYHNVWGDAITPAQEAALKAAFDISSSSRGVGAKRNVLEEINPIFPGKPEFTIMALDKYLKAFSGTCRLPLSYFNSESEAGNIFNSGAAGQDLTINKKMHRVYAQFKEHIIKLIELRWGIVVEDTYPNIERVEGDMYQKDIMIGGNQENTKFNNNDNNKKEVDTYGK